MNKELEYAIKYLKGKVTLKDKGENLIPAKFRDKVKDILIDYNNNEVLVSYLKDIIYKSLGENFAKKRDAIRWVDNYGFDCENEDITNFLGAFISLQENVRAGNENATIKYKVYLNPDDLSIKDLVPLNYSQMTRVYNVVRNSQLNEYEELKTTKTIIDNLSNVDKLLEYLED